MNRIEREKLIVAQMIGIYCRHKEHNSSLCNNCRRLTAYAHARLDKCPHGNNKPSCKNCTIHCYSPSMAEQIKQVMRFSGPRMLIYNPMAALRHMLRL